ncbi:GNAT family N-acetyltransferase [Streptomyces sp. Tu 3180]|uniref:GNAT family N-acetyltransferase n=1 Tax=Streptomyces sp. Tu 3180 TaxID=2682611 RepID=UPI00135C061D|nr:GNAT family N-acetyltransferase [Streptomyces sp. Tu 3180]KAF3463240.1 hypothetical protein GL259_01710 [Streptomyces sp. Tu 3180]
MPWPVAPEHGAQVTVQVVLEADGAAFTGRDRDEAAREVAESVAGSPQSLPHIWAVSSRVVSLWGLPATREWTAVAGVGGAESRLDAAGVSPWLTDWKVDGGGAWSGRRVMALGGGEHAGHLDVYVHPDGQAVDVAGLEVEPGHQRRGLASVMMDAEEEAR